jgi:hypothetical protein
MPHVARERVTSRPGLNEVKLLRGQQHYFLRDETAHLVARTCTSRSGST